MRGDPLLGLAVDDVPGGEVAGHEPPEGVEDLAEIVSPLAGSLG